MKPGKRHGGPASLYLVPMDGIDESVTDGLLQIISMHTVKPSRRQGHASKLLTAVCEEADTANIILVLTPEQFDNGPIGTQQLKSWYEKHGFNVIQDKPVLMCRDPIPSLQAVAEVLKPFQAIPLKVYDIVNDRMVDVVDQSFTTPSAPLQIGGKVSEG